jgi:hypothetical protein
VNSSCHGNDLGFFLKRFVGVGDDHLPRRCNEHAVPVADEDREFNFVFQILDLFAERRLGEEVDAGPKGTRAESEEVGFRGCAAIGPTWTKS